MQSSSPWVRMRRLALGGLLVAAVVAGAGTLLWPIEGRSIIGATEGAKVPMGRQTLESAITTSAQLSAKSAAAMGAGMLAALAGAGFLSLPVTLATRVGIDRVQVQTRVANKINRDRESLAALPRI